MITTLIESLAKATGPDRVLDCRLHECILGVFNQDKNMREGNEAHGRILLEGGGELRWFTVPEYTRFVDHALVLAPKGQSVALSYVPDGHAYRQHIEKRYAAMIRDERLDVIASAQSDHSFALAACILIVDWSARPKGK